MIKFTNERAGIYNLTSLLLSGAMITLSSAALVQTSPIETITVTADRSQNTAASEAPSLAPLDAVQPTSVISQDFIAKNLPPTVNYDEAIKFSPSVFDTAPNGPGLAESQNISIRGFQDGQFNVTFDGIPWGDSNDFTHHTTSYFMAHDLGEVSVDRGPGYCGNDRKCNIRRYGGRSFQSSGCSTGYHALFELWQLQYHIIWGRIRQRRTCRYGRYAANARCRGPQQRRLPDQFGIGSTELLSQGCSTARQ